MKKNRWKLLAIVMTMMMIIGSVNFSYATQEVSGDNTGNGASNEQSVNQTNSDSNNTSDSNSEAKNSSSKTQANSNNSESNKTSEEASGDSSTDSNDVNNSASLSSTEDNTTESTYETATLPKDGKEFHLLKEDDKMVLGAHYIMITAEGQDAITVDPDNIQYSTQLITDDNGVVHTVVDDTKYVGVGAKGTKLDGFNYSSDGSAPETINVSANDINEGKWVFTCSSTGTDLENFRLRSNVKEEGTNKNYMLKLGTGLYEPTPMFNTTGAAISFTSARSHWLSARKNTFAIRHNTGNWQVVYVSKSDNNSVPYFEMNKLYNCDLGKPEFYIYRCNR